MTGILDGYGAISFITNDLPLWLKVQLDEWIGQLVVDASQIAVRFRKISI